MNLTKLNSAQLRALLELVQEREALSHQLAQLDQRITAYEGGVAAVAAPAAKPASKPAAAPKRGGGQAGQRRRLRVEVMDLLKRAGSAGLTVTELAQELRLPVNRVYTWFYATGKNHKAIRKIGSAHYCWVG